LCTRLRPRNGTVWILVWDREILKLNYGKTPRPRNKINKIGLLQCDNHSVELSLVELGWVELGWVKFGTVGLNWVGLSWVKFGSVGLNWVGLSLVGLGWIELSRVGLN